MARRGGGAPNAFASLTNKVALLDELIRFEALAAQAEKQGYFKDPELVRAMQEFAVRKLEEDVVFKSEAALRVSDAEVARYYKQHVADYRIPERIHVAVIHLSAPTIVSSEKKAELAAQAEKIRQEALRLPAATRNFGYLAAQYSDDQATRYKGGDAGWFTRDGGARRWDIRVAAAAFELPAPGAVTPVLDNDKGFYLFKLVEHSPENVVALEQVAPRIRQDLAREKRKALLDELYATSRALCHVRVDEELLRSIQPPAGKPTGPLRPPPLAGQ